ncbi:MAG TPA: VOC family protein [Bacillota bacterium]|nr:VOC family protein [Bacillota bacterium]
MRLNHIALSVPDLEESVKWYKEILGFKELGRMVIPHNGVSIAFIKGGDFCLELLNVPGAKPLPPDRSHPDEDNRTHGVKHICITVDNGREFVEGLRKKGVKVVFEPEGMPAYGAFINDNTGNIIEIIDSSFDLEQMEH